MQIYRRFAAAGYAEKQRRIRLRLLQQFAQSCIRALLCLRQRRKRLKLPLKPHRTAKRRFRVKLYQFLFHKRVQARHGRAGEQADLPCRGTPHGTQQVQNRRLLRRFFPAAAYFLLRVLRREIQPGIDRLLVLYTALFRAFHAQNALFDQRVQRVCRVFPAERRLQLRQIAATAVGKHGFQREPARF